MRKYLAELHKKPDHQKRHFALLVSGTITLFIFGVWSMITFGINTGVMAEAENEVSPFQSVRSSLASSLEAVKSNFGELNSGLRAVDFEARYREMRDGALNIYGQ